MTILRLGSFNTRDASDFYRFAGYVPSDPALSIPSGTIPAPDGYDRLAFVDAPDGSGDTVVRMHLNRNDPVGAFTANSTLRTQLAYRLIGDGSEPEAALQTEFWYRFRYWLPFDFGVWGGTFRNLALWQLHETRDGQNGANTFTADAGTDVLTFSSGVVWPNGHMVEVKSTGTLPAPLAADTLYYVLNPATADETIQLSLTAGGAAINITSAGSGTHRMLDFPETPPLIASCYEDRMVIRSQAEGELSETLYASYPLERGSVQSIVVRARWDWTTSGFVYVWHNGRMVMKRVNVKTAYDDAPARNGDGMYPVMCVYAPVGWADQADADAFTAYFWDVDIGSSAYTSYNTFMQALGSADREREGFVTRGVSL